jgi:phosphoribosyl 1,2-cyclic phosphodiesterase
MKFTVLGSGSTGNAVLISAGQTNVLVDAGLSAREIIRRMAAMGVDAASLSGIIITHEHSDHAGGLRVLLNSVSCPVYISPMTRDAYLSDRRGFGSEEPRKRTDAINGRVAEIESSRDFRVGEIDFHPFTVPHDAADNFGFTATHAGVKIATLMDFGHITTLIRQRLRDCAAIVIESNHDRDMLKACDVYHCELKQRILSRTGHLSNEDVATWLRDDFDGTARYLVLAHLSQRANNPHVARLCADMALQERARLFPPDTSVILSGPKEPTAWIEL